MKFNFDIKTILFVVLILLFSIIFLYNLMPSFVEGFKEGADGDDEGESDGEGDSNDDVDIKVGDACDVSGNTPLYTINGATEYTGADNKIYKCDASNNVILKE
jgi:hypothetical protein